MTTVAPHGRPILVVDDVPANLLAAQVALEPLHRTVITATSGAQALACLLEEDFALVLLDVQMPDMDGYETAQWIRSRERSKHVPIIFLTAYDRDDAASLRAYELGGIDFILKPIVGEVLRAKAHVLISLQQHAEALARERSERQLEQRRRDYETAALRRERDRELAANEELARLHAALAESDRRKDAFISILAHELRNPLAPTRSAIDLLRGGAPLTEHMVDILDRQVGALARLVDDLLVVARINANKISLQTARLDLAAIVEQALAVAGPAIEKRGHAIELEVTAAPVVVAGDAERLGQVISTLLANAARYTSPGGRIEVTCTVEAATAIVRVRDNGIGIPAELQPSLFEMFVQERIGPDGSGGLGLGLALAHRLVELHAGTLTVHSDGHGCGSTFELRLPRAEPAAVVAPPAERPAKPIKTVVIDDNDDARELIAALLEGKGFEVLAAADGNAGLALIRDHVPDVAIVDLALPGLDGFDLVAALRAQFPQVKTRMIALSGRGAAEDRERTQRAGFDAHLVKPASAAAIIACIADQLQRG
ncbi:MAG TPA: response regulator [Kofleriaceae bacterium]